MHCIADNCTEDWDYYKGSHNDDNPAEVTILHYCKEHEEEVDVLIENLIPMGFTKWQKTEKSI